MYKCFWKLIIDFILSLLILAILFPILLVVIMCLYFSDKDAGIFFYQERPGKDGKIFKVIKFKTMTDERDIEGNLLPNEQRVTSIGRFIRSTSIDELPQLFNVLKGDMSLIGPRPLLPRYLELYNSEQARRHDVRPGITGWAQVNGRKTVEWNKRIELNGWYAEHVSFWLDVKILFMTVFKVLTNADNENVGETVKQK